MTTFQRKLLAAWPHIERFYDRFANVIYIVVGVICYTSIILAEVLSDPNEVEVEDPRWDRWALLIVLAPIVAWALMRGTLEMSRAKSLAWLALLGAGALGVYELTWVARSGVAWVLIGLAVSVCLLALSTLVAQSESKQ